MLFKIVNGEQIQVSAEEEVAIKAEWAAADSERAQYEATKAYLDNRKKEYPSVEDQLLAIWKSMDSGEIPQSKAFYNAIKAVNDKYPAPV